MTGNETPGKLINISIGLLYTYEYYRNRFTLNQRLLSPEHTYISIFGPSNQNTLEHFLTDSRIKIIYQANKAVNRREGHGTHPRNTLFVWEFSPDTAQNATP